MRHGTTGPARRLPPVVATVLAMTLTVLGLGAVVTAPVALAADGVISYVGSATAIGNRTSHSVQVPNTVQSGDLLLLSLAINTDSAVTAPAGWTQLEAADGNGLDGRLWSRTATAADAGSTVTATTASISKGVISVAAYRSSIGQATVSAQQSATTGSSTASLTTPTVNVASSGSWLVTVVAYKGSAAATTTLPAGNVTRTSGANTGGGLTGATVADSSAAVATGTRGGLAVTLNPAASRTIAYSIVVKPGSDGGTPVNRPPVASFTASCSGLSCSFDAIGSSDPDGDSLTYAWNFGDNTTGTGVSPSKTYQSAATRTVSLTVSDGTATDTTTRSAITTDVDPGNGTLSYVAAASSVGNRTSHSVQVPAAVQAGDLLLLSLAINSDAAITAPAGWTQLSAPNGNGLDGRLWSRTATSSDAGSTVTATSATRAKGVLNVAAYRSTDGTASVSAQQSAVTNSSATSLTTPTVAVASPGSWLVTVVAYKASAAITTTLPSGTVQRTSGANTGGGRSGATLGDSGGAVATGTRGGATVTVNPAVSRSIVYSVVVKPGAGGTPTNRPPVASFTATCTGLTCNVDASGSSDPDGDTLTYAWNFGDSTTGTGVTASRTYATAGSRTITLTVNDGTTTNTATQSVTVSTGGGSPLPTHPRLVSDSVLTNQPRITTGEITDLAYLGDRVFIVGGFTTISNNTATDKTSYNQPYLASWNRVTGLVDANFRPTFDGSVTDIELSPDGTKLFVAGRFNTVNGVTKRKFASINPVTGATVTGWTAQANGAGTELEATNTQVFLGGQFTQINGVDKRGLAAVDATTGALVGRTAANPSGTWSNDIGGGIGVDGMLNVQEMLLTPDLSKLIVVHTGRQIAGQDRYGVGIIDVATGQLLPWRTRLWEDNLGYVGGVQRAYAGAMAPDGQSFYVSSGSGGDRPPINDTIVKLPVAGGDFVAPIWVSRAFDSVYSVADSGQAVYIGGHFSWNESQTSRDPWPGLDNVGYGTGQGLSGYGLGDEVLRRDHLGALDPVKGKGVDWNPGSDSFEGNKAMLVTPWGLVTGGDGNNQGGSSRGRIAVFNVLPAPSTTYETTITEPVEGRVEVAGEAFSATGTAHAVSGVAQVQVQIRNRSNNRYLQSDLTTWGTAATTINATLASPGAVDTTWSLPLTITGNLSLEISAQTVAVNGSRDATKEVNKFETFSTSDKTPTARITAPSGVVPSTTFTLSGTADDDFGVRSIGYTIRDINNRYLQDDGSASSTYNSFSIAPDVVDGISTTWSTEVTVPYEGQWQIQVIPRDTAGQSSLDTYDRTIIVSSTGIAPSVTIQAPAVMYPPAAAAPLVVTPGSPLTFSGTATDDEGLAYVEIQLRNTTTGEALASDGTWGVQRAGWYRVTPDVAGKSTAWSYKTPFNLSAGAYTFSVMATDDLGLSTSTANRGALTINAQVAGDTPPNGLIDSPGATGGQVLALNLTGTATDDKGVASVKVALRDADTNRYLQPDGTMGAAFATFNSTLGSPGGTSTTWSLARSLPTEGNWQVTAYAYDTAGQQDLSTVGATAAYPIYPGDQAPTVTMALLAPQNGSVFTDGRIIVSGRVEDDRQIAGAQVAIVNSSGQYLGSTGTFTSTIESWRAAFLNSPGSPGSNYSYTTPVLPAGTYTVRVRGVDNHAFATTPSVDVTVTVQVPASNPPVASFTVACGVAPNRSNVCSFDARGTTDENPTALTYTWDFGVVPAATGSGAVVTRTYTAAGTYTVTLTAKDEWGNLGTTTRTVTMAEPGDNYAPSLVAIDTPACAGLSCSFVGRYQDNVGDLETRTWSWGDGTPNTVTTATVTGTGDQLVTTAHAYAAAGPYTVTFTVTDGWGRVVTPPVTTQVVVTN